MSLSNSHDLPDLGRSSRPKLPDENRESHFSHLLRLIVVDDKKVIANCLSNPTFHLSRPLKEKLKVLLTMIIKEKGHASSIHTEFWKNVRTVIKGAIDLLSGRNTETIQKVVVQRKLKKTANFQDVRSVLKIAELQSPVPFWFAAPELFDERTIKLAEGSFSEIYKIEKSDHQQRIIKVIPVEGESPVACEGYHVHLTFKEIIPEIYTSIELSKLSTGTRNRCTTFPNIYRICVVQDTFPAKAVNAWREYARDNPSYHARPDAYPRDQVFLTIETDFVGPDMDSYVFTSYLKAESVFKQIVTAVAVAEEVLLFEHRDMHAGNILIKDCYESRLELKFRNRNYIIETHGVKATIIDFTYSRIVAGGDVKYLKLDDIYNIRRDVAENFRDHRYVYSRMEDVTQRKWKEFHPKTNILWLKHIIENLLHMVHRNGSSISEREEFAMMSLRIYNHTCLLYNSASDFVRELILK